jgi:hypothetical protein
MQAIKDIILTCKDISPTIFINYTLLLKEQENMEKEIELAKKELISLGVDPDDENIPDKHSFWPYMDSEVEKLQEKIKIAQLKLSKCIYDYELLKNKSSQKNYEFQKVNSQIMEMLVYVIQDIAYKEEQKKLKNNDHEQLYNSDDDYNDVEAEADDNAEDDAEDEDDYINPDFPKIKKQKKNKTILFMITRFEPILIIVLSVLLLIHYKPDMSVM